MKTFAASFAGLVAALAREAWAMEGGRLTALFERLDFLSKAISAEDGESIAGFFDDAPPRSRMAIAEGVATIPVTGVLMKSVPKIFRYFGIDATSYSEIQGDLAQAIGDPKINSIRLAVDSPGGQVSGVKETADAIAASPKPAHAVIDDLGASAAYWLASQAKAVSATPNALVGSIGVYSTYVDSSKAAEMDGFKVHLIASGAHKGMGTPGVKITDEQLQGAKDVILGMADNFIADVARGRNAGVDQAREWATGQVWLAKTAKKMGLIDALTNEGTKGAAGVRPAADTKPEILEEETMDPKDLEAQKAKAASDAVAADRKRAQDIRAEFPEDPDFALEQIEKGASLTEAQAAYSRVLRDRQKAADLEARKPRVAPGAPATVGGGTTETDPGTRDFMAAVKADRFEHRKVCLDRKAGQPEPHCCSATAAMSRVNAEHPELRQKFVDSAAPKAKARKEALGWK